MKAAAAAYDAAAAALHVAIKTAAAAHASDAIRERRLREMLNELLEMRGDWSEMRGDWSKEEPRGLCEDRPDSDSREHQVAREELDAEMLQGAEGAAEGAAEQEITVEMEAVMEEAAKVAVETLSAEAPSLWFRLPLLRRRDLLPPARRLPA